MQLLFLPRTPPANHHYICHRNCIWWRVQIHTPSLRNVRHIFLLRSQKETFNTGLLEVFTNCVTVSPCLSTGIQEVSAVLGCQSHVVWQMLADVSKYRFSNIFRPKQMPQRLLFNGCSPVEREQHLRRPESRIESYTSLCNNDTSSVSNYVIFINAVQYAYFLKANCL